MLGGYLSVSVVIVARTNRADNGSPIQAMAQATRQRPVSFENQYTHKEYSISYVATEWRLVNELYGIACAVSDLLIHKLLATSHRARTRS